MKTGITFIFCLIFLNISLFAQDINLSSVEKIADSLKENANAVYRLDEGFLNIESPSKYNLKVHQVITVLNSNGAQYLNHSFGIDKFRKVNEVSIKVYNNSGQLVKKYSKKDFSVKASYDGISIVTDNYAMNLYTPPAGYPCTIEVEYQINVTGYIELPNWYVNTILTSTENFRYVVDVPAEMDIRHRSLNYSFLQKEEFIGKQKRYTWEAKNIVPKNFELDGFEMARYLPQVEIVPNYFEYDGYAGSFKSWKDFGKWNYDLYEEKNPFSKSRTEDIKLMVSNVKTEQEKISILYSYLQKNMRYVSIQLGIGGFKPFTTAFVDEKKYGDCKALTNYMRNLLGLVGIKSYPALINAGYNKTAADPKFPTDPFNHVILCIPNGNDTTWLECTSNKAKVGELGSFTENKNALLLTEAGGVLIQTPRSQASSNRIVSNHEILLQANGGAQVKSKIFSTGDASMIFNEMRQMDAERQKEVFFEYLDYIHPQTMTMAPLEGHSNEFLKLDLDYKKLLEFSAGNKFFFPVAINKLANNNLKNINNRKTEYVFDYPFEKQDTTTFIIPIGFSVEGIPANHQITTDFTMFKREAFLDKEANKLKLVSSLTLKNNFIPSSNYNEVVNFFTAVHDLEMENLILIKQ